MGTYTIPVKCENCGNEKYFTIEKGESVNTFLDREIYEKCNCEILIKTNKKRKKQW